MVPSTKFSETGYSATKLEENHLWDCNSLGPFNLFPLWGLEDQAWCFWPGFVSLLLYSVRCPKTGLPHLSGSYFPSILWVSLPCSLFPDLSSSRNAYSPGAETNFGNEARPGLVSASVTRHEGWTYLLWKQRTTSHQKIGIFAQWRFPCYWELLSILIVGLII